MPRIDYRPSNTRRKINKWISYAKWKCCQYGDYWDPDNWSDTKQLIPKCSRGDFDGLIDMTIAGNPGWLDCLQCKLFKLR